MRITVDCGTSVEGSGQGVEGCLSMCYGYDGGFCCYRNGETSSIDEVELSDDHNDFSSESWNGKSNDSGKY